MDIIKNIFYCKNNIAEMWNAFWESNLSKNKIKTPNLKLRRNWTIQLNQFIHLLNTLKLGYPGSHHCYKKVAFIFLQIKPLCFSNTHFNDLLLLISPLFLNFSDKFAYRGSHCPEPVTSPFDFMAIVDNRGILVPISREKIMYLHHYT